MKSLSEEYHLVPFKKHKASFHEMVLVFTIAAIAGYFIETGFVFLSVGKIVKRGMLLGPYCPIYGFGALILYSCFYNIKSNIKNIPLIFIMASLILGSFELMCGLVFKYILNIEMWNYSDKTLNILNYTTVPILIGWGILGTIYVFLVHPIILKFVSKFKPSIMKKVSLIVCFIFIFDFILSVLIIESNPIILDNLVNPQNAQFNINRKNEGALISPSFSFLVALNY